MSKFNIKYGRLYEIRNRYQLAPIHAWGMTAFRKKDVENAIAKYNEEQGKAQQEAYYTCFDIMQNHCFQIALQIGCKRHRDCIALA